MLKVFAFYSLLAISIISCKKDAISTNDFRGTYRGKIEKKTLHEGTETTEPYTMTVEIIRDTSNVMKLNFDGLSSAGVFTSENKFKLNGTIYPNAMIYGSGEFNRNKLIINYSQIRSGNTQIIYTGTLDKF